jgi:hypothetical protein
MVHWAQQVPDFEDNVNAVQPLHDIVVILIDHNQLLLVDLNYEIKLGLEYMVQYTMIK